LAKEVMIGNAMLTVYSLRYFAAKLHRSVHTIKFWEYKKLLPTPLLKTKDGGRWYTNEEINMYVRLAEEEQIKNGKSMASFTVRAFCEVKLLARQLEKQIADLQMGVISNATDKN